MGGKFGIVNIINVINLILEAGNVLPELQKDQSSFSKFIALGRMGDELMSMIDVDFDALKKEILELDNEDKRQISIIASKKYDIKDDVMEAKIEMALDLGIRLIDVFVESSQLYKR